MILLMHSFKDYLIMIVKLDMLGYGLYVLFLLYGDIFWKCNSHFALLHFLLLSQVLERVALKKEIG